MEVTPEALAKLEDTLLNTSGEHPLHNRFRALFTLKAVGGETAIEIIAKGFKDPSPLLKHELAYVLGQLNNTTALPHLTAVLENQSEDPMVRHEAAEALGAISSLESLPVLNKYLNDEHVEVRETCEVAIGKIEWDNSEAGIEEKKKQMADGAVPYNTIDPAPGHYFQSPMSDPTKGPALPTTPTSASLVPTLRATYLDTSLPLFTRYRAMFSLRNVSPPTQESVEALADGFGDKSALFRHEIAYVFGQLSSKWSVKSLVERLSDENECEMVRHECAEALGGIASEGEDDSVLPVLKAFAANMDAPSVVRESCIVALDMWEYENSNAFQYADGLSGEQSEEKERAIGGGTGFERSIGIQA